MLAKLLGGDCVKDLLTAIANDVPEEMADLLASAHPSAFVAFGSPLHVAATYGAEACMGRLLANGASANAADKDGHTPLHLAAIEGSRATICQLLGARADPSLGTEEFRARLMGGGLSIDMPGGRTALHLAAAEGNLEAARALLAADASLASRRDGDGATPLEALLCEGARGGVQEISLKRRRIAEVLAPGFEIPSVFELRAAWQAAAARRRERCDAAERECRERKRAEEEARGLPKANGYEPKDPELYSMDRNSILAFLARPLASALALGDVRSRAAALRGLAREITPGVFAFELFVPGRASLAGMRPLASSARGLGVAGAILFGEAAAAAALAAAGAAGGAVDGADPPASCLGGRLLEELRSVEAWAQEASWAMRRPNSMNRYGVVVTDVGLRGAVDALVDSVMVPLVQALWPEETHLATSELVDRHAFTVRYRGGEDRKLDTHVDSSDLTLNLCLGGHFRGGGVYFHGRSDEAEHDPMVSPHPTPCSHCRASHGHEQGIALLHLGDHVHGAHNIKAGERNNLVVWCRQGDRIGID